VPDEPTPRELARRLDERFTDVRDDIREMGDRLEKKVALERYGYEQQGRDEAFRQLIERVRAIETAREAEKAAREKEQREETEKKRLADQRLAERRAADRRLIFTALIAPVLILLLTVWLSTRGAGK
jgi:CHASE3 domain sensor protein